jgi:hypothetical protein
MSSAVEGDGVAARRLRRRSTPAVRLDAEHTGGCEVLPNREALMARLPPGGVAAELGVALGDYTRIILERNRPRKLHLVDPWDSDRYRQGLAAVRSTFAEAIASGVIEIHQGYSTEVLATFPDRTFDWIYLDTDHSYETTLAELRLAAPKLKPGGFLAGHDYCTGNVITTVPYGVVEACHMFCVEAGWRFAYLALEERGRNSFALTRL